MLRGLERQLAAGDTRAAVGERSGVRVTALLAALHSPKRFRVPESAGGLSPEGMAYTALREEWTDVGERWRAAVESLPPGLGATPLVRHPYAGPLTVTDTLRFLAAHAARHRRQFDRASAAALAPPAT